MCGTVARVPTYNPKPGLSGRTLPGGPSGAFDGAVVADPPSYAIRGRWAGSPTRYTNGSRPELQSHSQRTAQANLGRSAYRRLPAWRGDPTEQQDRDTRIFGFRCYRRPAGRLAASSLDGRASRSPAALSGLGNGTLAGAISSAQRSCSRCSHETLRQAEYRP